jgi:DNA-binding response OmpR family regulator
MKHTDISHRTGRLLIIDDDPGVRQVFAKILRRHGHEVRAAANADDGLHEVRTFAPDALLLDLRMPLINGFGFLYRLRIDPELRDLPVAIITGDCSLGEESLRELRALGAEVWHKPLSNDQLIALADRLLSRGHRIAEGSKMESHSALCA